jgi:hypothetical protein
VNFFAKLYYPLRKAWKAVGLYLVIAGPGMVVMVRCPFCDEEEDPSPP